MAFLSLFFWYYFGKHHSAFNESFSKSEILLQRYAQSQSIAASLLAKMKAKMSVLDMYSTSVQEAYTWYNTWVKKNSENVCEIAVFISDKIYLDLFSLVALMISKLKFKFDTSDCCPRVLLFCISSAFLINFFLKIFLSLMLTCVWALTNFLKVLYGYAWF